MADASGHDENVPDDMAVGDVLRGEEHDADRVHQSAGDEPEETDARDEHEDRFYRDDCEPAHQQIDGGRRDLEAVHEPEFEEDARESQRPHNPQKRPAPCPAQVDEQEWRVGARDEQVNRGVVEDFENALPVRQLDAVIERGGSVQADERGAVDRAAHDAPSAAAHRRENKKHNEAGDAEHEAEPVRHAVRQFFQ